MTRAGRPTALPMLTGVSSQDNWRQDAACITHPDPDLWFPDSMDAVSEAEAVAICNSCPVLWKCRAEALQAPVRGVWGGTNEDDRRNLIRRQKRAEARDSECGVR